VYGVHSAEKGNLEISMIGLPFLENMKHGDVVSFQLFDLASIRLLRY
jgi:hypothetical protein